MGSAKTITLQIAIEGASNNFRFNNPRHVMEIIKEVTIYNYVVT